MGRQARDRRNVDFSFSGDCPDSNSGVWKPARPLGRSGRDFTVGDSSSGVRPIYSCALPAPLRSTTNRRATGKPRDRGMCLSNSDHSAWCCRVFRDVAFCAMTSPAARLLEGGQGAPEPADHSPIIDGSVQVAVSKLFLTERFSNARSVPKWRRPVDEMLENA